MCTFAHHTVRVILAVLRKLVQLLVQYKEIASLIVAIVGGVFFVNDHFATKRELAVLQCQMQNSIDSTDSEMKSDQLARRVVSLQKQVVYQPGRSGKKTELELEIDRLKEELTRENNRRWTASDNLVHGNCERIVDRK